MATPVQTYQSLLGQLLAYADHCKMLAELAASNGNAEDALKWADEYAERYKCYLKHVAKQALDLAV